MAIVVSETDSLGYNKSLQKWCRTLRGCVPGPRKGRPSFDDCMLVKVTYGGRKVARQTDEYSSVNYWIICRKTVVPVSQIANICPKAMQNHSKNHNIAINRSINGSIDNQITKSINQWSWSSDKWRLSTVNLFSESRPPPANSDGEPSRTDHRTMARKLSKSAWSQNMQCDQETSPPIAGIVSLKELLWNTRMPNTSSLQTLFTR